MKLLVTFLDPATTNLGWRLFDDAGAWVGTRQTTGFTASPAANGTYTLDIGTPASGAMNVSVDGTDSQSQVVRIDERIATSAGDPFAALLSAYAEGTIGRSLMLVRALVIGRRVVRREDGDRLLDIYDTDGSTILVTLRAEGEGPYSSLAPV